MAKSLLDIDTSKSLLTNDEIVSRLFWFHSQAHFMHLQTHSNAEHLALDKLYKSLVEVKDSICESLLGYTKSRFTNLYNYPFKMGLYKSTDLCDEIISFASKLEDFADSKGYCGIENLAQGLSELASDIQYLLTLK